MMRKLLGIVFLALITLLVSCGGGGGYAGNTGPTNALRMTPLLSTVTIPVGYFSDVGVISDGVAPYFILSSDPSVGAELLRDGTVRVRGLRDGTSTIAIQDSSVAHTSISFTVTAKALTMTSSVGSAFGLTPNQSKTFSISGGLAPFAVSSSDDSVVTVSGANGTYTAVGHKPGAATLLVSDSVGTNLSITVTVSVSTLAVTPSSGTDVVGGTLMMSISGGLGPYSASVLNPGMVNASISGSTLTLGLRAVGSTVVTVTDSLGSSVPVSVAVNASRLSITPPSRTVGEKEGGGNVTFAVSGDAPPFQVSIATSDAAFATSGSIVGNILTVNLGSLLCVDADRSVPIIVTDAFGTVSIATVLIKDQGAGAGGVPIPCP